MSKFGRKQDPNARLRSKFDRDRKAMFNPRKKRARKSSSLIKRSKHNTKLDDFVLKYWYIWIIASICYILFV